MTKQEAKALTIDIWEMIAEHGLMEKEDILEYDEPLWHRMLEVMNWCPLCELFLDGSMMSKVPFETLCNDCPLNQAGHHCGRKGSHYSIWVDSIDPEIATHQAKEILKILKEWTI